MLYRRTGTYVAFHAEGSPIPTESDMRYYYLLQAWHKNEDVDFSFVNSHEKAAAVRDSSKRTTLLNRLFERLRRSKNMVLIIGKTTREDTDWVPLEIEYAIDTCEIPIIAAYPDFEYILAPDKLAHLWPDELAERIDDDTARVIHIPFKRQPIKDAIRRFGPAEQPSGGLIHYTFESYQRWGIAS